jgi:hypothetical protein
MANTIPTPALPLKGREMMLTACPDLEREGDDAGGMS